MRIPNRTSTAQRLGIGLVALALLLVAEVLVIELIRGVSLAEYVTIRDKVSETV